MQDIIIKRLAEKYNKSEELIDYIIKDLWKNIKAEIGKDEGKEILLKHFGSFYIDERNLKYAIGNYNKAFENLEVYFQENKDKLTDDEWIDYIKRYNSLSRGYNQVKNIESSIERRKNRVKGARGL